VTDDLRIGLVGAGGVARRHATVLDRLPGVTVAAVADPEAEAARTLGGLVGATPHRGADEMLAAERLDAVYVCVPPFAHGEPERSVLAAGLPLFVEKPLAADLEVAEQLAREVAAAGVVTATGYHWRHLDTVQRAAELLADRPARLVVAEWFDKVPPVPWWTSRSLSGGQLVEQATHLLDLARVLAGEVTAVTATGTRWVTPPDHATDAPTPDVDVASAGTLRFASGAVGTVAATSVLHTKYRAQLTVVADGLALDLGETHLVVHQDGRSESTTPRIDGRHAVDAAFVEAVRGGPPHPALVDYAEALRTHRVGVALARAAETGTVVAVDQEPPVKTAGPETSART
jgi:myo-inositol 2-dehydrogenase / D-chiro-inositol 1-dehydrogenase